jgi:hypothetical protein
LVVDAVRKQLHRFLRRHTESILVLSGDQLYVMDFVFRPEGRRRLRCGPQHVVAHADDPGC